MLRAVPCCRCLHGMATWEGGNKPSCQDTDTASNKCTRCRTCSKPCITPSGVMKARGVDLARVLSRATERNEEVKNAQLLFHRAFQSKKNTAAMTNENVTATAAEIGAQHEERRSRAAERTADAAEHTAAIVADMAKTLSTHIENWNYVYRAELLGANTDIEEDCDTDKHAGAWKRAGRY